MHDEYVSTLLMFMFELAGHKALTIEPANPAGIPERDRGAAFGDRLVHHQPARVPHEAEDQLHLANRFVGRITTFFFQTRAFRFPGL